MARRISGPFVRGNELIQIFRVDADYFSSVSVLMATYGCRLGSNVTFSLFRLTGQSADSGSVKLVVSRTEKGSEIINNETYDLYFQPEYKSAGHIFMLKIFSDDGTEGDCATAWLDDSSDRIEGHEVCLVGGVQLQGYGLIATAGYSTPTPDTAVPETLIYSPATQCNLNCVHCISRETRNHRDRMPEHVRTQIREWCHRGLVKKLYTDYSGDILWADERWPGELDYVINLGVTMHIDTNGACLTEERSRKLLHSKLAWLNVSLDAAHPETYARIRKGAPPLESVLSHVRTFVRLRHELRADDSVTVSLGFTLMKSNIGELLDFIRLSAKNGVIMVTCRHLEAYTEDMMPESLWHHPEIFNEIREKALALAKSIGIVLVIPEAFSGEKTAPGHKPCRAPWSMAVILGNGDVQVCCLPRTKIGNLNEKSLEEIWTGHAYADFRLRINSDRSPAVCNACAYSRKTGNRLSYLPFEATWKSPYSIETLKSIGASGIPTSS